MTESASGKLIFEENNGIATLTFNHPEDIIDIEVMQDMITVLGTQIDSESIEALLIKGRSSQAFSMGYNGSCVRLGEREFVRNLRELGYTISRILRSIEVPVVSQIRGFALGLGFEIALSSDFIIASSSSRIGLPDIKFGMPSFTGVIPELMTRYGAGAYNKMISGEIVSAQDAKDLGLISAVTEDHEIGKYTEEFISGLNKDLVVFYKAHTRTDNGTVWKSEKMFIDLYDLSKIRIKDLERFRKSLTL